MTFKGRVIAHRDTSYDGKRGRVAQETLTCMDAEDPASLLDTVDCVFDPQIVPQAVSYVGKVTSFIVEAVRPSNTQRVRFIIKGLVPTKA